MYEFILTGAAILSGDFPFYSSSPPSPKTGANLETSYDAIVDLTDSPNNTTAGDKAAPAISHTAQTASVTTPASNGGFADVTSIQPTTTSQSILPQGLSAIVGGQQILPKGKEPIRILPASAILASTNSTTYSTMGARTQIIQSSRPTTSSPSLRPLVDIQPRDTPTMGRTYSTYSAGSSTGNRRDFNSPSPTIDTKILILPPGSGQPPTPKTEQTKFLIGSGAPSIVSSQSIVGRRIDSPDISSVKRGSPFSSSTTNYQSISSATILKATPETNIVNLKMSPNTFGTRTASNLDRSSKLLVLDNAKPADNILNPADNSVDSADDTLESAESTDDADDASAEQQLELQLLQLSTPLLDKSTDIVLSSNTATSQVGSHQHRYKTVISSP